MKLIREGSIDNTELIGNALNFKIVSRTKIGKRDIFLSRILRIRFF